jgi:hypothetical protein
MAKMVGDMPKQRSLERLAAEFVLGIVDWQSLSAWASAELARPDPDDRVLDLAIMLKPDSIEVAETLQRTLVVCGIGEMDCVRAAEIELAESAKDIAAGDDNALTVARRLCAASARMNSSGSGLVGRGVLERLHSLVMLYEDPFETEPFWVGDGRYLQDYFLGLVSPDQRTA